jgi:hypothetical protein
MTPAIGKEMSCSGLERMGAGAIPSDVMMAWGKHSLEQDTGNPETVGMGAEGATANGSRMAGTGAAGSDSPAGARATVRLAVSELSTGAVT